MSDFLIDPEPRTPFQVQSILFEVSTEMLPDMTDELPGVPPEFLGTYTEYKSIRAKAVVIDQFGQEFKVYSAGGFETLVTIGVLTQAQSDMVQTWLDNERLNLESRLLPPSE